jgi:hypothetical protein
MKTFEQWTEFLSGIPPEDLPSFKDCQGNVEGLIARLAEQYAKADIELETEAQRLDALSPEERAEDFFREQFGRLRERGLQTEYDRGYYDAMLTCAVCLAGINSDYLIIEEKQDAET